MIRRLQILDSERCVGCQSCMFACTRREGKASLEGSRIRVRSIGGMERGFTVIVCRACQDPSCMYSCPTSALEKREVGGVKLLKEKCIGCGKCVEACPISAISMDEEERKPLICLYCGYCKSYCAYGVLDIEEVNHGSSSI
jgi:carbon-monoxide dehydrogenase iron sulfur subunit